MTEPVESPDNLPQSGGPFKVLAVYKFAPLPDCAELKTVLAQFCCARRIRGTFILAPEGINGTVAGTPEAIDALADWFQTGAPWAGRLAGAEAKFSSSDDMPFHRMKVRLKPEIVTLRAPEADPSRRVGTYVEPADWNALIDRNDVLVIDTRNDYEVALGSFARAADPHTKSFTEFKDYVAKLDPGKTPKVAMFCTGGIRCEKASAYMLEQGFPEVFHLKGGILKYLETVPEADSRFAGECFVFDERVSVTHGLEEGHAELCRACRTPMAPESLQEGICPECRGTARAARAEEREHQMQLARSRGTAHLGDDAATLAMRNRVEKQARRAADRKRQRGVGDS